MKWIKQKVIGFLGKSKDEQREKKTTHPARDSCNPRSNDRETNANSSELRVDIRLHSIASNLDRSHDAHRGQSRFFLLPDAASLPHTERGAVTRTSLNAREREKKSGALEKDERANDASRVPLPFADVEETAVPTKDAVLMVKPNILAFCA